MAKKEIRIGDYYDEAFKGLKGKEVIDNIEGLYSDKEEGAYTRALTDEEISIAKTKFADVNIQIAGIEKEKKEATEEFKMRLKDPKIKSNNLLDMIKHRSVDTTGTLYLVADQESGMMHKFDERGVCVDYRPLMQKERQLRINPEISKAQ